MVISKDPLPPSAYALLTYQSKSGPHAGVIVGSLVYDLAELTQTPAYRDMRAVLSDWVTASAKIRAAQETSRTTGIPVDTVALLTPLQNPGTIYCAGANYKDHMEEMAHLTGTPMPQDRGSRSWHFIKSGGTVVGPRTTVQLPVGSQKIDWEVELAAVIGRRGKNITIEHALDHVAAYSIAIDLSARDLARRTDLPDRSPFKMDWLSHKNFDGACPLGPYLVPADQVYDPQALDLCLLVNGEVKQASNTVHMIFSVAEQIRDLSERMTLWPGDIILTGTPAGVGSPRGEFLQAGDVLVARVQGMGELVSVMARQS